MEDGSGERVMGLPGLLFPYLEASVASKEREGKMKLKLIRGSSVSEEMSSPSLFNPLPPTQYTHTHYFP